MEKYDRRCVTAPSWIRDFHCIAEDCPDTCCQQWNIEVDPLHAELYEHLEDRELRDILESLVRGFRVRKPGQKEAQLQYRLQLTNRPDQRCPLLNESGQCRLQKKYGAYILCDTCYFHPRNFWQLDEQICLSACLSCPECARLALLPREPVTFVQFETEIDPYVDWLETSMIADPGVRELMRNRDLLILSLCTILQNRALCISDRLYHAEAFLDTLVGVGTTDENAIRQAAGTTEEGGSRIPADPESRMRSFLEIFVPVSETIEKPVQGAEKLLRSLAGGRDGFVRLLADNYESGCRILDPFLKENEYLLENFLVNCVFSDSFRQFHRCRSDFLSVPQVLRHESALLRIWDLFIRVQLAQTALTEGSMNAELFLRTVSSADKTWWHYPDWFARCADRLAERAG